MKKRVRMAVLGSRGIPAKYGGFETFAEELATRLAATGFEVDVFCEAEEKLPEGFYKGVRLIYIKRYRIGPFTTILFDIASFWKARKQYDLVYMLGYGAGFFAFVPRLWKTKVWINMDGVEWARSKWSYLARLWFKSMEWTSIRTASRVIADAEAIKMHLIRRHGSRHECSVIAYGAYPVIAAPNPSGLKNWGLERDRYFLVVCRLEPENHVLEIIRGFIASGSEKRLIIVGEIRNPGPYVSKLIATEDERVLFIGTVFDKELLTCLRFYCHAYFHGHSVGGTNPSLLEAMGCGNLIIAHDNGFNREVLGNTGVFFKDENTIPDVVRKIEELEPGHQQLKTGALARIVEKYSWEQIASQYVELLGSDLQINPNSPNVVAEKETRFR